MRVHGRGGAGGGLSSVTHDATLSGAGTIPSPLGVNGGPAAWFGPYSSPGSSISLGGANEVYLSGFLLPTPLSLNKIWVSVGAADLANLYDIGLYNFAGTLVAHIGAQALTPHSLFVGFAVLGAPISLPLGIYAIAWTGNATTGQLIDSGNYATPFANVNYTSSSGGALPASVNAFTIAPQNATIWCGFS